MLGQLFEEGRGQLHKELDNTRRRGLRKPSIGGLIGDPSNDSFEPVADEMGVKDCIMSMTHGINNLAKALEIKARIDSGSGRSGTFANLVMRPVGAVSNYSDLSKFVLGVGVVTGDWDFEIHRDERLEDAMQDPKRAGAITAAIQRVCASKIPS